MKTKILSISITIMLTLSNAIILFSIYAKADEVQSSWPTFWIKVGSEDENESGSTDDYKDGHFAYYNIDSDYLYFRLECYGYPNFTIDRQVRYKLYIDIDYNMTGKGSKVYEAEYILFVEDSPKPGGDGIGEVYLIYDDNNDGLIDDNAQNKTYNYLDHPILNNSKAGFRTVDHYLDMYIRLENISNSQYPYLIWATDNEDPNLDSTSANDRSDCFWGGTDDVDDDSDPSVNPGATEICGDGVDQDCDGSDLSCDDVDDDSDGFTENEGDCDDSDPSVNPGATEICGDGVDQDCDGSDLSCDDVDDDSDGFTENEGDCDDSDPSVNPGATEICDGKDNDCDGSIDEGCGTGGHYHRHYEKPTAVISGIYTGVPYEEIEFNATESHDNDEKGQSIVRYHWKFSDELEWQLDLGATPTHIYTSAGFYNVTLKVIDDENNFDTNTTLMIIIKPNIPPTIPEISGPENGTTNVSYNFTVVSTDEDGDEIKYTIDWDDGASTESDFLPGGIVFNTAHKWIKPGIYPITVTAEDNETISTNELTIEIKEPFKKEELSSLLILLILLLILLLLIILLEKRRRDKKKQEGEKQSNF